jgi:hypothetical protein
MTPPCWNWKQNRLERIAAEMRARYARAARAERRKSKRLNRDWVSRRKEYLLANGRVEEYHR